MPAARNIIVKWTGGILLLSLAVFGGIYYQRELQLEAERKSVREAQQVAQQQEMAKQALVAQQQEVAKLARTVETLENTLSKTADSLSAHTSTVESLQSRNGELQADHQKLQEKYEALQAESRRLNQTIAKNEAANVQRQIAQKPIFEMKAPEVKVEPRIELPRPRKREVDLIIKSVSVKSTDSNGSDWDASGPPDLMVSVKNAAGEKFDTEVVQDQHSGTFNVKSLRVSEGDTLTITVWDSDVFANDEIGSFTKTISADTMQQGTVNWSFGGVSSLVLEFQP